MMMASLTNSEEIKGKGKGLGFSVVERRRRKRKKEASGIIRSLEASFYTQKGRNINEIPKIPLE